MNYNQLVYQDRVTIEIQLNRGSMQQEIAGILKKNPGTISREINRNSVRKRGNKNLIYLADEAEIKAYQRCWRSKIQSMKINMNSELKRFIIHEIQRTDIIPSPKIIAGLWNKKQKIKKKNISHISIYKWLETGDGNKFKKFLAHSYKGYRNKTTQASKVRIKGRIGIEKRPQTIQERLEKGHYEADLVVSKKGYKGAILTLIDRKTRFSRIFKIKNKSSKNIMILIASVRGELGIKSVTFDNGMEFAFHHMLHKHSIDTYFCNPYSSWEKGSIENLNKIIRRFFPKGTIFDHVSDKKIRSVCDIIANTPREILGFLSPNQVHFPIIYTRLYLNFNQNSYSYKN